MKEGGIAQRPRLGPTAAPRSFFFPSLFFGLSTLALRDTPFMGLGSGSGTLRTGTGQVLGLVLGKDTISFYISPSKNRLLGCAQCNMTARISPTERPGQRIRSGADHARARRDTARAGRRRWTARPIAHRCVTEIRAQQLATTPAANDPSRQMAAQTAMKQRRTASRVAEEKKKKLQQNGLEAEDGYRSLGRGARSQVRLWRS